MGSVPSGFVGLSFEYSALPWYTGADPRAVNPAFEQLVRNLAPGQSPVLRIETGMHTAMISRIGVDAACTRIATASDDKTARLWSLPDGKLQRTNRPPIGTGLDGDD